MYKRRLQKKVVSHLPPVSAPENTAHHHQIPRASVAVDSATLLRRAEKWKGRSDFVPKGA